MDGSKLRMSDAAVTRKRRSSILKSQRPPRTPFSELEFKVATPTDAKSRRVSFSRRNGVAEFEITEATTAWKNVYEEHNKSLESSVNASDSKGENKPLVAHLGSRVADSQFEDAEADIINSTGSRDLLVTSFGADNQDYTSDDKSLSAPYRNFELSEFTSHHTNQLFDDDANPIMKEMTDHIDLNFSAVAPLAEFDQDSDQDKKGDLSYIDVDFNATHFSLKGEESSVSDMSITDTIHSPKVAASKTKSEEKVDNWVADKENIVVNPYVAPLPAENFAVTDCDDVLVFDGKKCKFQSDLKSEDLPDSVNVPDPVAANKRRTIVFNDDAGDISITQAVTAQIILPTQELNTTSRKMYDTMYGDESNISMTQAVPSNIIISNQQEIKQDKQETIYFNDLADMTVTEAVPSIVLGVKNEERRKTIVYQDDEGHVSMTEAVPVNIILAEVAERRKTIVYQNEEGDISLTQAVPINILQANNQVPDKRKPIVYEADATALEMTEAVPENVLLANNGEKRKTILFANDDGNMSVTQAAPTHLMPLDDTNPDEQINNITFKNNATINDIPFTLMGPGDVSLEELQGRVKEIQESIVADVTRLCSEALSTNQNATESNSKRRTIMFNDDQGNVSITQALPVNILDPVPPVLDKKKSIIYEGTAADISITQAVPVNLINKSNIENDIIMKNETAPDCTITVRAVDAGESVNKAVLHEEARSPHSSPTGVTTDDFVAAGAYKQYHDNVDKSVTQAASNISNKNISISNDNLCNVLVTNPIPAQIISIENDLADRTKDEKMDAVQNEMYVTLDSSVRSHQNIIVYEAAIKLDKSNEDVSERNPAEKASNLVLETYSSNSGTEHEAKPEPMEEDENTSNSTESMVYVHDDPSKKQVKENENPIIGQTSILNDLLDMSNASMDGEQPDKNAMTKMGSDPSFGNVSVATHVSKESYLIIKDSNSEPVDVQTSETRKSALTNKSLPIEFENDKPRTIVEKIHQKLGKLKSSINFKNPKHKHIKCANLENVAEQEKPEEAIQLLLNSSPTANKTANNADDTDALLDLLSHFTDTTRVSKDFTSEDNEEVAPIEFKGHIAIEDKSESTGVRRSAVPDRRSMVRSREDLLKDISMAQAMLQYADETTEESDDTPEPTEPPAAARAARVSNEVVKTLKFDDDESMRHEPGTPLKKTAFGETTYMHDSKTKVIPEYLSYTSDLKDLMDDLVKPLADAAPVGGPASARRSASTCSTQIQANLLTSSQIDLVPNQDSSCSVDVPSELASSIAGISNKAISRALRNEMVRNDSINLSEMEVQSLVNHVPPRSHCSTSRVIVFDHQNPLNNVLLPAIDTGEVHGYDPRVSVTSLCISERSNAIQVTENDVQRNVESRVALHSLVLPCGEAGHKRGRAEAVTAPRSVDQGVDASCLDLKDSEVNTLIIMRKNNELLDASSSLTLVDDALQSPFQIADSSPPSPEKIHSPVKVIFKVKEDSSLKLDTDFTSADDDIILTQAKKRVYSPAHRDKKHCTFAHDITPKPASKVQKVSNTPKARSLFKINRTTETVQPPPEPPRSIAKTFVVVSDDTSSQDLPDQVTPNRRKSRGSRLKTPDTALTIHHLITEYDMDANIDQKTLTNQIMAALNCKSGKSENSESTTEPATELNSENASKSLDVLSSDASSKRTLHSESEASARSSSQSRAGWQPELLHEMSSKNLVAECDSSVNVVAKIDVLPFMGSSDCEWESRGADAWALRLLRGRLRLVVRLEHRHDNAPRTRVRGDTPVRDARVQPVADYANDDPIKALCVRFACEAMQQFAGKCARAGDAPELLRRCAGVARVAVRWARAMHYARVQLAYTLAHDGALSLKVANIPLRSVWEVTMRLQGCAAADEGLVPVAAGVRVARVVSEVDVPAADVARLLAPLPRDWGHVPGAIWKIFKHLKHKTLDEDILII